MEKYENMSNLLIFFGKLGIFFIIVFYKIANNS